MTILAESISKLKFSLICLKCQFMKITILTSLYIFFTALMCKCFNSFIAKLFKPKVRLKAITCWSWGKKAKPSNNKTVEGRLVISVGGRCIVKNIQTPPRFQSLDSSRLPLPIGHSHQGRASRFIRKTDQNKRLRVICTADVIGFWWDHIFNLETNWWNISLTFPLFHSLVPTFTTKDWSLVSHTFR